MKTLSDGKEWNKKDIFESVAKILNLSEEEKNERIPSGPLKYQKRMELSFFYLVKAGLIERTKLANLLITEEGRKLLKENPPIIDNN
ncbi:MAG TPA: winged helix-turn-helix domain-containing protein, partial [Caldisericia bacterium]|nr:winged helix-turn-helix domain-containing protein [Caldisericia bacterium]